MLQWFVERSIEAADIKVYFHDGASLSRADYSPVMQLYRGQLNAL
jgi:hypothetical protein